MDKSAFFGATRRKVACIASAAVLVGLAACGSGGGNPNPPKMTNVPGAVTASPAGSSKLTGHFEIKAAKPGDPFIFSGGVGGACVFAQYPAQPKTCTRHSDCALPPTGTGQNAEAVCIAESPAAPKSGATGQVPPNGAGTCWIKPSDDFCLKGVSEGPHDTPPADSKTIVDAAGVNKWRVVSCLNGVPGACGGAQSTPNEIQLRAGSVYAPQ